MLKQRIVTAIVLVPPLVAALFLLPLAGIVILLGAIIAVAAWEWGGLSGLAQTPRFIYVTAVVAVGAVAVVVGLRQRGVSYAVFAIAAAWWLWALVDLRRPAGGMLRARSGKLLAGILTLVPPWLSLSNLHATDSRRPLLLLFVLILVAVADTAAYAAGHVFGRTKLAPAISPGKTVEGVIGGATGVVLAAYVCGTMVWHFAGRNLATWIGLATVAGLISVVGDLSESKLKRMAGVKDSGTLLPGHGGILDRIDALTAAAPVFAWGWLLLFDAHA
jgi:phosphatidate cytidylyltransferase